MTKVEKRDIGFVAQELEHVVPEIVFDAGEGILGVKYELIVSLCLKALQEQKLILSNSEAELEKYEMIAKEKGLI